MRVNLTLEQQVSTLSTQLQQANNSPNNGSVRFDSRGGLQDKKLQEPDKLEDVRDFKEWSEDFKDCIAVDDPEVAELLDVAKREQQTITALGGTEVLIKKACSFFMMLKKTIKHKTTRLTVTLAPAKNPYEGWRLLPEVLPAERCKRRAGDGTSAENKALEVQDNR